MNTFKALFRALLVMLFLWMFSLLVFYWPLPQEVVRLVPKYEVQKQAELTSKEADQRLRMLPVD